MPADSVQPNWRVLLQLSDVQTRIQAAGAECPEGERQGDRERGRERERQKERKGDRETERETGRCRELTKGKAPSVVLEFKSCNSRSSQNVSAQSPRERKSREVSTRPHESRQRELTAASLPRTQSEAADVASVSWGRVSVGLRPHRQVLFVHRKDEPRKCAPERGQQEKTIV